MQYFDSNAKKYFFGLLALEILTVIFLIIGGNFMQRVIMTAFRVAMLVAAHCCADPQWASLYSVFALLSAIYAFDPVGLFITGHGSAKTVVQNISCLIALILNIVSAYLGYLYAKCLNDGQQAAGGYPPSEDRRFAPVNNPPQNNQYFGGTNYLYQQPPGRSQQADQNSLGASNTKFHAFSGHAYRLE